MDPQEAAAAAAAVAAAEEEELAEYESEEEQVEEVIQDTTGAPVGSKQMYADAESADALVPTWS